MKAAGFLHLTALVLLPFRLAVAAEPVPAAPALPGADPDVLVAAAELDSEPARAALPPRSWLTGERARKWAPAVVLTAATLAVDLGANPPREARWDTRNHFDDAIQDGLGGGSASTRKSAATASTVLVSLLGAAMAIDVYLLRDEYPVEQSLVVGLTATAGNFLLGETAKVAAGRERPYVRPCRGDPGFTGSCNSGRDDNTSFLSTHASESAALAGLVCARRLHRGTVKWTDRLLCGTAVAASATTGILRISAEEHYFTDVLAGWGSGLVFGALLPLVLPEWSGIGAAGEVPKLAPLAGSGAVGLQFTTRF